MTSSLTVPGRGPLGLLLTFQVCAPPLGQSPDVDSPASLAFALKVLTSPGALLGTAPPPPSGACERLKSAIHDNKAIKKQSRAQTSGYPATRRSVSEAAVKAHDSRTFPNFTRWHSRTNTTPMSPGACSYTHQALGTLVLAIFVQPRVRAGGAGFPDLLGHVVLWSSVELGLMK